MLVGGIAAWRLMKDDQRREAESPSWRDDSLDQWRRERDAEVEAERAARLKEARETQEASIAEREEAARKHQRIGG